MTSSLSVFSSCRSGGFRSPKLLVLVALGSLMMGACTTPPPPPPPVPVSVNSGLLEVAPKLSRYNRFELVSQASGSGAEQKAVGSLNFKAASSSFDVFTDGNQSVEHWFVQPDACRDDPSQECQRRFVVSGRLSALNSSLNCFIPVRNDTSVGYSGQPLAGICQDRNGRSFTISIFSN